MLVNYEFDRSFYSSETTPLPSTKFGYSGIRKRSSERKIIQCVGFAVLQCCGQGKGKVKVKVKVKIEIERLEAAGEMTNGNELVGSISLIGFIG
jgi:hypothetical protein